MEKVNVSVLRKEVISFYNLYLKDQKDEKNKEMAKEIYRNFSDSTAVFDKDLSHAIHLL